MSKRIFVTATNTDIGKTYTSKLLIKEFASRGMRVGAIKLIETGVEGFAPDAEALLSCVQEVNPEFKDINVKDIVPITYTLPAAPYVASNALPLDLELLSTAVEKLERLCDVLIIEGAGGLYVPVDEEYMMIDMIEHFEASALLVTHCSLGCINDTILSERALNDKNIKHLTAFNCREGDESFKDVSEPYFRNTREKVLKTGSDIDTICDVLYNL
ncbi:MAG: dethiobiotin synthase [Campylobacterota bacterium]